MAISLGFLVLCLIACAPATPVPATGSPVEEPAPTSPANEEQAPTPVLPTEDIPVVESTLGETEEETPVVTTTPTPSEWEQVQQTVEFYRNRLDRSSDGYQGLTTALEQTEPNQAWCSGLNAAFNDFSYINDEESAQALRDLQDAQGCN